MRLGCDLVALDRFARAVAREDFVRTVFDPREIAECMARAGKARVASFAGRFAVKEAFSKALGIGLVTSGVMPRDVCVVRAALGRPELHLAEHVRALLAERGLGGGSDVSLSHDGGYAMATVILY